MTRGRPEPDERPPTETERHEALLERLRDLGAPASRIGEAAMDCLEHLLSIGHPQLAAWHACQYEPFWDDGRKLEILERMQKAGLGSYAILLCHRWKLSEPCTEKKPRLYRELFPKLPPRAFKGGRP